MRAMVNAAAGAAGAGAAAFGAGAGAGAAAGAGAGACCCANAMPAAMLTDSTRAMISILFMVSPPFARDTSDRRNKRIGRHLCFLRFFSANDSALLLLVRAGKEVRNAKTAYDGLPITASYRRM
jgi:hypothetical protein